MKRGSAIFLFAAFIYGTTLYPLQLWYRLYQEQEWTDLVPSDNEKGVSSPGNGEEIVFKVPLSIPYHSDWEKPMAASGLFERDGEFYTIVSKNYKQDTIYITCYQNTNAREIFGMLADSVKPASEKTDKQKSPTHTISTNFFKKDFQTCPAFVFDVGIPVSLWVSKLSANYLQFYDSQTVSPFLRPPIIV